MTGRRPGNQAVSGRSRLRRVIRLYFHQRLGPAGCHQQRATVIFCDGHVKGQTRGWLTTTNQTSENFPWGYPIN